MQNSNNRRPWAAALAGAVAVAVAGWLWSGVAAPRVAYAQIPDSGEQRNEMINELRTANKKLTEITGLLREIRDVQVGAKRAPEAKPSPGNPPSAPNPD